MYNATHGNKSFQKPAGRTGYKPFNKNNSRRPANSSSGYSDTGRTSGRSPLFGKSGTNTGYKRAYRPYGSTNTNSSFVGNRIVEKPVDNRNYNRSESSSPRPRSTSTFKSSSRPSRFENRGRSFSNNRPSFGSARPRMNNNRGRRPSFNFNESTFIKKVDVLVESEIYSPSLQFESLDVHASLKENINSKNYFSPTPIQDKAIPHIMNGKDVLGIADTGTGKTAAFLIPLINKIEKNRSSKVIIITPTRELAEQINDELYLLTKNMRIFSVQCIGGSDIRKQIFNLRRGYNFVIGTPGRLKDLFDRKQLNLAGFDTVVLDEVDRMLDMGFVNEIKHLISFLPADRQSLFFSATVDRKVGEIIDMILKPDHIKISVKTGETAQNVEQDIVRINNREDKMPKLEELLNLEGFDKVLVFVNTKRQVDKIEKHLFIQGYKVDSIHGDKRQNVRKRSIEKFKQGSAKILIATDVAARGLDIKDITHVINFDVPNNYEDYIHRVGRTGRANKKGQALTFVERR
jgi:ATP-dependent RNA helicase RhlE